MLLIAPTKQQWEDMTDAEIDDMASSLVNSATPEKALALAKSIQEEVAFSEFIRNAGPADMASVARLLVKADPEKARDLAVAMNCIAELVNLDRKHHRREPVE